MAKAKATLLKEKLASWECANQLAFGDEPVEVDEQELEALTR